jgi:hypothetical protein
MRMTDEELEIAWREADCGVRVENLGDSVRITWTDHPLDFIVLAPKAFRQLVERLQAELI